jgi:hypothetical protein
MLDFIGTVVTAMLLVFVVNAVIVFMDVSRFAKLTLALAGGWWIGLTAAVGAVGMLAISKPFPVVGIFAGAAPALIIPLALVAAIAFALVPVVTAATRRNVLVGGAIASFVSMYLFV